MWVEGFDRTETGQCWRNLLLCPVRPTSGICFPPSLRRTDHAEILFLFSRLYVNCCTKLVRNTAPVGLYQMVLFSFFLSACQHSSSWAVLGCGLFLPRSLLRQRLSTPGCQFSTVRTSTHYHLHLHSFMHQQQQLCCFGMLLHFSAPLIIHSISWAVLAFFFCCILHHQ